MKNGTIVTIILGLIMFMISSCGESENKPQGYPVVNSIAQISKGLLSWKIVKVYVHGDATHFRYVKGDSARYIQTVNSKITIDHKWLVIK